MFRIAESIRRFMQGRYGNDQLNFALFAVYIFFTLINMFAHSIAILILMLAVICIILVRALSRNIYTRINENKKFLKLWTPVKGWLKLQANKLRDRKTHVYRRCDNCKANIRLPRRPGKHTVRCPKCGGRFNVTIR